MAIALNGTSQYINIGSAPVTAMPLTIACWFRLATVSSGVFQLILQINNNAQATTTTGTYRLLLPTNNTILRASQATSGTSANADSASGSLSANTWTHGAGVFTSTTSRAVYVNGVSAGTNTTSLAEPSVASMNIGAAVINTSSASAFMSGSVAEVGVWSAALDAMELNALADGVSPANVRPQSLAFYSPLIRDLVDYRKSLALTNVGGATASDHPRVYA